MNRVFLDTNILLDYLAARSPFDQAATELIRQAEKGEMEVCASALSFCNIAYILKKLAPAADLQQVLSDLSSIVIISTIDSSVISAALSSSFQDFEDAIQHFSALDLGGVTHLITRNTADFTHSLIPVFTPSDYLIAYP